MIDAHCHILPAIDDGARHLDESLGIARELVRSGVRSVFATPHFMKGSYSPLTEEILSEVAMLSKALARAGIALRVLPGAENYPEPTLPKEYKDGRLTTLGGSRYLLIEAPAVEVTESFEELLFQIALAGAQPVLAHPERNPSFGRDVERLGRLFDRGILLQVNARSLLGGFGRRAQVCAEKMARHEIICLLGSDAHTLEDAASMKEARSRVERLGGIAAKRLLEACEQRLMASVVTQ